MNVLTTAQSVTIVNRMSIESIDLYLLFVVYNLSYWMMPLQFNHQRFVAATLLRSSAEEDCRHS